MEITITKKERIVLYILEVFTLSTFVILMIWFAAPEVDRLTKPSYVVPMGFGLVFVWFRIVFILREWASNKLKNEFQEKKVAKSESNTSYNSPSENDEIYIFKVSDYSTELVGRKSVDEKFFYVQRGDGFTYQYDIDRVISSKKIEYGNEFDMFEAGFKTYRQEYSQVACEYDITAQLACKKDYENFKNKE